VYIGDGSGDYAAAKDADYRSRSRVLDWHDCVKAIECTVRM